MAEQKKKSSWEIPPPGPGTISGFFVAWVFVAAIIGLTLVLMGIGKGPLPLRVVAYDISLEGIAPGEVETILAATTPWVERAGAGSDILRKVMEGKLDASKAAEELRIEAQEVGRLIREPRVLAEKVMRGELTSKEAAGRLGVKTEEMESYAAAELERLTTAIRQTNPMVLLLQGTSDDLTKKLALKLEVKEENVVSEGSSAILSKYSVERPEGEGTALIRYGKKGKFGVVSVDLREAAAGAGPPSLEKAVDVAKVEFGETPHAILALVNGVPPAPPSGYVNAPIAIPGEEGVASRWHAFIPETIEDNLKECYVPAENKAIEDYSDKLPIVAHFVFRKKDFE